MRKRPWSIFPGICLVIMIISNLQPVQGQVWDGKWATMGRIDIGASFLNLSELNSALEEQFYIPLNENFFALGLGLDHYKRRWVFGGNLYNYMINESALNGQKASINYHYLQLRAGYVIYRKEHKFHLYPSFSLGAGMASLKRKPLDEFYLDSQWTGGPIVDVALRGSFWLDTPAESGYQIELGITAGYIRSFENVWILHDFYPDNRGIRVGPEGLYLRVSIGMGKRSGLKSPPKPKEENEEPAPSN